MEFTHFERVMKDTLRYDQEGRAFARKAVAEGKPSEMFYDFLKGHKDRLREAAKSEAALIRTLLPLNGRAMMIAHHITKELLKLQEDEYSFEELTKHPDYATVVGIASVSKDELVINSSGNMYFHMAAHDKAGLKVYEPSVGLAEQLRHTELRGLEVDNLELPHRSIYLKVPSSADLKIWNDESGWHSVIGIYVVEERREGTRSWRFLVCGETKPIKVAQGIYDDNDALVYFNVPLPEGMRLDEALATTQEEVIRNVEDLRKRGKDSFGPMLDEWQDIFRWAMNVMLYLTLDSAEVEEVITNKEARQLLERIKKLDPRSKKRRNLNGRLGKIRPYKRIILGRSIARRGGWELMVRVQVRGHWRNQPHGPGRMYRRLQWIEPYWKGPEDGSLAGTTTEVASAASEKGTRDDQSRNGEGSPVFERTATLPTEGVDRGDHYVVRTGKTGSGQGSSRLRDPRRQASGAASDE